jgi:hypothetical protein
MESREISCLQRLELPIIHDKFLELIGKHGEKAVSEGVFEQLQNETIDAYIGSIWIRMAQEPKIILDGLQQDYSVNTKFAAVKRLAKELQSSDWKKFWNGVGGLQGMVDLLADFSVLNVGIFFKTMRQALKQSDHNVERGRTSAQLLRSLRPKDYPKELIHTHDQRPVYHIIPNLILCDEEFTKETFSKNKPLFSESFMSGQMVTYYLNVIRDHVLDESNWPDMLGKSSVWRPTCVFTAIPNPKVGSSSMAQSTKLVNDLLQKLVRDKVNNPDYRQRIVDDLIYPLLKRGFKQKRKTGLSKWFELCELVLSWYEINYPGELSVSRRTIMWYLVKSWVRLPKEKTAKALLIRALHSVKYKKATWRSTGSLILGWVLRDSKYHLLTLLFQHLSNLNIDIEDVKDLEQDCADRGNWPLDIIFSIERKNALALVKRLRTAQGNYIISAGNQYGITVDAADIAMILGLLGEGTESFDLIKPRMADALVERDPFARSQAVIKVVRYAIASGSLVAYASTLQWTKRYVKDHVTFSDLFGNQSILRTSASDSLLSGVVAHFGEPKLPDQNLKSTDEVKTSISKSHEIVLLILEIFTAATREPFFQKHTVNDIEHIIPAILHIRFQRTVPLMSELNLNMDEIYDLIWKPTLALIIKIQEMVLEPHLKEKMPFQRGFHTLFSDTIKKELSFDDAAGKVYARFIDELSQARDKIWQKQRRLETPVITTIKASWFSSGLPLSQLNAESVSHAWANGETSFLTSRAEAIVFANPKELLSPIPIDEDLLEAFKHTYRDSYLVALKLYVLQAIDDSERQQRSQKAFAYATTDLSQTRFTPQQALRFWYFQFKETGVAKYLDAKQSPEEPNQPEVFVLPYDDESQEPMEWNPIENIMDLPEPAKAKVRITYLDWLTKSGLQFVHPVASDGQRVEVYEPSIIQDLPIVLNQSWRPNSRLSNEGYAVASLLQTSSLIGSSSVLKRPFPSSNNMRFPAVYLADEFIQDRKYNLLQPLDFDYIKVIPSSIVLQLATAQFADIQNNPNAPGIADQEQLLIRLMQVLKTGDNPNLAIDIMLKFILEQPGSSSWHRRLISPLFFKGLSSKSSELVTDRFSKAIQERLKLQAQRPKAGAEAASETRPYVKITTVKQLIEYLDPAYVSTSKAIDILTDLLYNASHIDIRVPVIAKLGSLLETCTKEEASRVVTGLELMIPICGGLSESTVMSEEDWFKAEQSSSPPLVNRRAGTYNTALDSPILWAIICLARNLSRETVDLQTRTRGSEILTRVLLPIVHQSIATNARWLKVFAAKYEVDLDSLGLPNLPVRPAVIQLIMEEENWHMKFSQFYFDTYFEYVMVNLLPSEKLRAFNQQLQDRKDESEAIYHWRSLFSAAATVGCFIPSAIAKWDFEIEREKDDITLSSLEEAGLEQAKTLILHHYFRFIENFMRTFLTTTPVINSLEWDIRYSRHSMPNTTPRNKVLMQQIIDFIGSLRTPEWQQNPNRQPKQLLNTLKYSLWLLPYPPLLKGSGPKDELPDNEKVLTFAKEILKQISAVVESGVPYDSDLAEIRVAAGYVLPYYRARLACLIGRVGDSMKLADYLRVDIAMGLMKSACLPRDNNTKVKSKALVKNWHDCKFEYIWEKAEDLRLKSSYQSPKWAAFLLDE